ncbi:MAG: HAMP domain-containing sensor histidine kinase [Saprospiraceae bacterium]
MTNAIIRRVIVLGAVSILSLLSVQTYWILRTWDLQEREFNRKVNQAMLDAANDLSKIKGFTLPTVSFVGQLSSNYWVVNINNVFEADDLEYCLDAAFQIQNLKENYEYGIFDCSSDQMVRGKLVRSNDPTRAPLAEPLPKHYESDFIYYFGVRFPDKKVNILTNMWVVVMFSGLMLITIAFFIYSMFVILRQKQLSELQRDFINNMTHEFKTPISTINISTDVFLQNEKIKTDPRLDRYARIIKEQVMRLNTQVEKVLQLAKIERENIELNQEEIDMTELIPSISPSIELKVNEKNGLLHLDLNAAHARIRADRLHLTNILHNLVDNAVKYSKDVPDIHIILRNEGRKLVLRVKDNGMGIPKEHQKRVFDKFYRVPTGNVHNVKGFGLGLFYVKSMCQAHRWKLDLASEPGKGTTISITMPIAR